MPNNPLYYRLKPFIPLRFRIALRRWRASRLRNVCGNSWPILEQAGKAPEGWRGWPEGKRFAFVLTHDVEGQKGLDRTPRLSELDASLGFRSAFNFVPEGEYRVTPELRAKLTADGFEVGVHDLKHDGFLYRSRAEFKTNAQQINQYVKSWNASGFRSGFMHHNLDWFHDLEILYDASTFDTDPFEPQPDGVETIFPFWVPGPDGRHGYVELPYTLIQDFNLFVVLKETTTDIWKKKLDWIAKRGGMALLIVHPDYTNFSGNGFTKDEFPAARYAEFLSYVKENYAGQYWQALPRDVARFVRDRQVTSPDPRPATSHSTSPAVRQEQARVELVSPAAGSIDSSAAPKTNGHKKAGIWIDLDNTPHVVFFEPIIEELRSRGYPLLITARDAFQVCELADQKKVPYVRIGRHYGKNRFRKAAGLLFRALQLAPVAFRERPVLSLSHGARSQIIISNLLGIPTLLLADYEFAEYPPLMRPTWEMVPAVIPDSALCCDASHIRKYPGIKEDVYVWKFQPDPAILDKLGLKASELIITVRPPATEAHYHNPESEQLFVTFMERACNTPNTRIVLLPRNKKQGQFIHSHWPEWFVHNRTVIPNGALDGLNLIWHSDLLVSGGGTMNREAAALGVPVYSIFRGTIGAVDRHLQQAGRLILIESVEDVASKIRLEKREHKSLGETTSRRSLDHIVKTVEELAESISSRQKPQH
jgi:predicted glycosyltransferase